MNDFSDRMVKRARDVLLGLAMGDALGMPAQTLPRDEIVARYGRISDFVDPFPGHPVSHGLHAGQVTDDTEQSFLLARRLIANPDEFDEAGWARDLLAWEEGIRARGLHDLLGPSSKAALRALLSGVPATETGRRGTTNGASMRIAPVGIITPPEPEQIVAAVARTCRVTHNTGEAIAAASAVAMMISLGMAGQGAEESYDAALAAARLGQAEGYTVGEADMAGRIARALDLAEQGDEALIAAQVGSSVKSHESVPAAFALLKIAGGDPWRAACLAANIGDDTDTIGAIAGAMAGATSGGLPAEKVAVLRERNALDFDGVARGLAERRSAAMRAA